jgi:hypothetical protein
MMPYLDALDNIHMPKSLHLLKAARERLAMEECMALQVRTLVSYYPPIIILISCPFSYYATCCSHRSLKCTVNAGISS